MSQARLVAARSATFPVGFIAGALGLGAAALCLAGWAPLRFSIVTVFLFAGPHNWLECRYFLSRMPARWGRLRVFFTVAFAGIFLLAAGFIGLYAATAAGLVENSWEIVYALLSTLLILWIALLTHLRSRQNPRRDWPWIWPTAFLASAVAWYVPLHWGLLLVYGHPLMAFWLLDRELQRSRPEWRPAWHVCLACLPFFLGLLWWRLGSAPALEGDDPLALRIAQHAGAAVLPLSSHMLVATHTFLEMLHYGVWVLAIPLIGYRTLPWKLDDVPLRRRSLLWRRGLLAFLAVGAAVVVVLWGCFLADYTTTRDVYFTVALLHVLAEFPFLLRAL